MLFEFSRDVCVRCMAIILDDIHSSDILTKYSIKALVNIQMYDNCIQ